MPNASFYKLNATRRKQMLSAAAEIFSEQPYHDISVFNLAARSGIPRSSFYYYFKDKEDIYRTIFQSMFSFLDRDVEGVDFFSKKLEDFRIMTTFKGTSSERLIKMYIEDIHLSKVGDLTKASFPEILQYMLSVATPEWKSTDKLDLLMLQLLANTALLTDLFVFFNNEISAEQAVENYEKHLSFLKEGFLKADHGI